MCAYPPKIFFQMPLKMHKILFFSRKKNNEKKYVCLPT